MLDRLVDDNGGFKNKVELISYDYTKRIVGEKITVVFYDMITLYFEASDEDDASADSPRMASTAALRFFWVSW